MYESGYNKLFWGMIFIIFNINIGPINLLPNFIGYVLIFSGLGILVNQNKYFAKGRMPAAILIVLTIKDIVNMGNVNLLDGKFVSGNVLLTAVGVIETLLTIYLIFSICRGIFLLAEERGLNELRDSAKFRFNFYMGVSVLLLIFTPFSINLPRNIGLLMILGAVVNIIALLLIAGLFRKCKYLLGEEVSNEAL